MSRISVIVPVYNVERYLRQCVDSVLAQSYRDLEVILVDDGSSDACPAICDAYASQDERVKVIHKPNGGLSDARNAALDIASGDLIGFVDSDDFIAPDMYERLACAMERESADIACCGHVEYDSRVLQTDMKTFGVASVMALSGGEATRLLLYDKELQNYVWNKLFRAHLWEGVRFPVGQRFEDVNTTYKLFEKAKRCVLLPDTLYYYRVRADGIVRSRTLAGELDCVTANMERCEALAARYPQERRLMEDDIMRAMVRLWPLAWEQRRTMDGGMRQRFTKLSCHAREYGRSESLRASLGITGRLTLPLLAHAGAWSWFCAWLLRRAYGLKHEL